MLLTVKNPVANIYKKKIIKILRLLPKFFLEKILLLIANLENSIEDTKLMTNIRVLLKQKIYR